MKSTYIWAVSISLILAALLGCDKTNKRTTVVEGPPATPAPTQPQWQEPVTQPPAPPPVAQQPVAPPAAPQDVYTPPPSDETKPLPPERRATRPRARTRTTTAEPKESYAPARSKGGKTYTVKKGDTLQTISKQHYGTVNQWRKIYNANKSKIKDPNKVVVGTKLNIPPK